ncbi:MAG: hypothetical protein NZT92_18705 [Abditibacteriales bacterium]|nr:hypothetical protein [Abditibacteriales bacterium]MDW8367444.1 hypothetical protein [Abditibacteriales bacterium]
MTRLILFDTDTDTVGMVEVVSQLSALGGIRSFEVLEAATSPRFCVLIETDDTADATVAQRIDDFLMKYAAYVSSVLHLAFRKVQKWGG